jgi:ATP-dependent Clp protease ATP-binding subunit ClpA
MAEILRAAEKYLDPSVTRSVGTEHVLLALIEDREGVAGRVLDELGVATAAHQRLREIIHSDAYRTGHVVVLDEQNRIEDDYRTRLAE